MNRRPTVVILILLFCCANGAGGCATTRIIPPPATADDVPVFITDYGRHSSILLPAPQGHYVEYAFGDLNWFALNRTTLLDGLRALFWSAGSTLGRRQLDLEGDLADAVAQTAAEKIARIDAPRERVEALRRQLDAEYFARHDSVTYNPTSAMWFVRSDRPYHLLRNCNHVTARWLRALGCQTRGSAMFSSFIVAPRGR